MNKHGLTETKVVVEKFLKGLKSEQSPKFIGLVGYCFGARFAIRQISAASPLGDACAVAHPSNVTMEEIAAIGKVPIMISAAETDVVFTMENRYATGQKLREIGATYIINLFSGVYHGFAIRGNLSSPDLRFAMNKTISDQIYLFDHFSKKT